LAGHEYLEHEIWNYNHHHVILPPFHRGKQQCQDNGAPDNTDGDINTGGGITRRIDP
jgi:hypothetical protein